MLVYSRGPGLRASRSSSRQRPRLRSYPRARPFRGGNPTMSARTSIRDVTVGLIVIAGLMGLLASWDWLATAPGFSRPKKSIDVVFRDGQGIRVGSPVRVAAWTRETSSTWTWWRLRARCGHACAFPLPANLVKKLRQDVKVGSSSGPHWNESREHRRDRQVGRGLGARPVDPGCRELVLRPDHRAGRAGTGRAEVI